MLLTTPHMLFPDGFLRNFKPHRLIIDEAHLLSAGSTASKLPALMKFQAERVWLLTAYYLLLTTRYLHLLLAACYFLLTTHFPRRSESGS